jgi:TatD DNase family protein
MPAATTNGDEPVPVEWIDSHCHLPAGVEGDELVGEAHRAGVVGLITIGTDLATSQAAAVRAGSAESVWATAGVHPHDAELNGSPATSDPGWAELVDLLARPRVVAVGECGLDYHYDHSPRATQRQVFDAQVEMANILDVPLVIHTREAWDDTFAVLDAATVPSTTIFHCFTGGPSEAERCLERGAFLSFSGIVTFASADEVRAAAAMCPLDRLLVETDSPYLAPAPHRGAPNRPALVVAVGRGLAEACGRSVAEIAEATTANARHAFRLEL